MEIIDIIDKNDNVISSASQQQIYQQLLPHRIVHILIFNDQGKMALQLRSQTKSFCPNHWSTSVGGHVQTGEDYKTAALREFQEELGLTQPITFLYKDLYDDSRGLWKYLSTFKTTFNGPFKISPEEVEKVEFFTLEEIQNMIDSGEKFHPELLFILEKHFQIKP